METKIFTIDITEQMQIIKMVCGDCTPFLIIRSSDTEIVISVDNVMLDTVTEIRIPKRHFVKT